MYYFYVTQTYYTVNIKMYRSKTYDTWNKTKKSQETSSVAIEFLIVINCNKLHG